jgi:hypothetical protein
MRKIAGTMAETEFEDLSDEDLLTWISEIARQLDVQFEAFNETLPPTELKEHVQYLHEYITRVGRLQGRLDALRQEQRLRGHQTSQVPVPVAALLQSSSDFHLDVIGTVLRDEISRTQADLAKAAQLVALARYQDEVIELTDKLDELIAALHWVDQLRQALGRRME